VVLGSGAAGLASALAASEGGANVLVLERSDSAGGTTAISGGIVWAPANHLMIAAGISDSDVDAIGYLNRIDVGGDAKLRIDFVQDAPRVVKLLEERTPLRWALLADWPDYHSEEPGGSSGGRSLWPAPLELSASVASRMQTAPEFSVSGQGSVPYQDLESARNPSSDAVVLRGPVRGRALVGGLLAALDSRGVEVRLGARPRRLVVEDSQVKGVDLDGETIFGRVVVATGGFQHDPGLAMSFLRAPGTIPMGTPGCSGDGLRMAMAAGASLANMGEGWWMPAMRVEGEELGGSPYFRPLHGERAQPGALMVDRTGRRFVNEARNYGDVGRAMQKFEPQPDWFPAMPSWLVFDAACRSRSPLGPLQPTDPDPTWLARAPSIGDLAKEIGVDPGTLEATVERFNQHAALGKDADFNRGERGYDRWIGNRSSTHPTLGALQEAPFYALEVHCGCMGTKGGPRTDGWGRVLAVGGDVIEGLYAAGNAAANPFGIATPAGGATLGPALVFGTRAGEAAATDR
jgi:3-oxosteroid 1-dehydrogenase